MPPRPARTWRKSTGPRESSLIAIAIASRQRAEDQQRRAETTMSRPRLAIREARFSGGAPIESSGRPPIWLSELGAVEQLEEAGDDVDGDAVVAAGADAAQ